MTIYARATVNGGADQSGAISISDGDVVQPKLTDYSEIGTLLWEIISYPTGFSTPSGWTAATGRYYWQGSAATGFAPPSIDFTSAPWGLYWFRVTADNGISGDDIDLDETRDTTLAVYIPGPGGLWDVPVTDDSLVIPTETFRLVWGAIQKNLRLLSAAGLLPTGSTTGQIAIWNNTSTSWEIPTGILAGNGYISVGSDPAQSGAFRLTTGEYVTSRIGSVDRNLIGHDGTWIEVGDASDATRINSATVLPISIGGNSRVIVYDTYVLFDFGDSDTRIANGFLGLNGVTSGSGIDVGGLPIENFHHAISPTAAQTIPANGTPAYIALELDGATTYVTAADLGVTIPDEGVTESVFEVGFRVLWRNNTTGALQYCDELSFHIGWREASSSYYVQAARVNTVGSGEGAADTAVTVDTTGSLAEYRLTVTPSGSALQIALAMLQDASTARRAMAEAWRSSVVRNFY